MGGPKRIGLHVKDSYLVSGDEDSPHARLVLWWDIAEGVSMETILNEIQRPAQILINHFHHDDVEDTGAALAYNNIHDLCLGYYPFATVQLEHNWSAGALRWQAAVTAATLEELYTEMEEVVQLHLEDSQPEHEMSLANYLEYPFEVRYIRGER